MGHTGVAVLDVEPFRREGAASGAGRAVVDEVARACRTDGVFAVVGHGIEPRLHADLVASAREFFALGAPEKDRIAMRRGGRAWRGWFPLGGELTAGVPDDKEGLYFGTELPPEDPRVRAGLALHGANLFPERPAELRSLVLRWMQEVTALGQVVLRILALGLDLEERWFDRWCADPVVLFRIFRYPPQRAAVPGRWGVAEHTDYGLLTLLAQDGTGGLEAHTADGWQPVPADPGMLVCNLGDMVERVTGGRYLSTPHRVRVPDRERISMPLFLDPAFDAVVSPLPGTPVAAGGAPLAQRPRWDQVSVFDGAAQYGHYLEAKVSRVFPELWDEVVGDGP